MNMQISSVAKAVPKANGRSVLEVAGRPFFELNSISTVIWNKLTEGLSTEEIVSYLSAQFNVPVERVTNDVCSFVETLKQSDLVKDNARTLDFHVELVWNKGIAARCDWRIPDEFPPGLGFAGALEPVGHSVPPYLLDNLIPDPKVYREIREGDLVWVKFSWIKSFLRQVLPIVRAKFILVTADSDIGAPLTIMAESLQILEYRNVLHWYAQNCDGPGFMGRMSPTPIGIDFHTLSDHPYWGQPKASPLEQEQILKTIRKGFRPACERIRKVYVDFAWQPAGTYLPGKRQRILGMILTNECFVFQSKPLPREILWRNWGEYAFVLSPHGRGLDCHRTWEALACGNIVLVPSSPLDRLYEGLPVIPIKDWNEITPRNLDAWLEGFHGCEITEERLTNAYWVNQMRARANKGTGA
jgi:hypothetical protein